MAAIKACIRTHKDHFTRDRKLLDDIIAGTDVDIEMVYDFIKTMRSRFATFPELDEKLVEKNIITVSEPDNDMEEFTLQHYWVLQSALLQQPLDELQSFTGMIQVEELFNFVLQVI